MKTAWRTACEQAAIVDLHFHDLRREFACRLLESRAELHDVRDFLGHTIITTTSRYLRSTTLRLERALTLLEEHEQRQASAHNGRPGKENPRKSSTLVPHGASNTRATSDQSDAETVDVIEDVMVSQIFTSWDQMSSWLTSSSGSKEPHSRRPASRVRLKPGATSAMAATLVRRSPCVRRLPDAIRQGTAGQVPP